MCVCLRVCACVCSGCIHVSSCLYFQLCVCVCVQTWLHEKYGCLLSTSGPLIASHASWGPDIRHQLVTLLSVPPFILLSSRSDMADSRSKGPVLLFNCTHTHTQTHTHARAYSKVADMQVATLFMCVGVCVYMRTLMTAFMSFNVVTCGALLLNRTPRGLEV